MKQVIRKAVIPVAGLGTRFLPATKAMPKEMLTIVDRPVIQRVVDEARAAGIEHFVFVTGRNKGSIEDHFDRQPELEAALRAKGKDQDLALLARSLPAAGQTSFVRQQAPLGLGHAIWCARDIIGNEPFAVLLPDVVTQCPGISCLSQLIQAYEVVGGNIVAVEKVPTDQAHQYGIVANEPHAMGPVKRLTDMVEKPAKGSAPSDLMIMGRYILSPEIFAHLKQGAIGAGGEIQLTDAMRALKQHQDFHSVEYQGRSFDCGSKIGFLTANIAFALNCKDLGPDLLNWLSNNVHRGRTDRLRAVRVKDEKISQRQDAAA